MTAERGPGGFHRTAVYITTFALSVVVGFIVQGNFSNLTSGVLAVATPRLRGATIGLYSWVGFGAGFLGTLLFGVTLEQFGGTSHVTVWVLSFGTSGSLAWLLRRHDAPAARPRAKTVTSEASIRDEPKAGRGGQRSSAGHIYEETGVAADRAFNSSSAKNALRLRPAEIASTQMLMRSIKRPKSSGEAACVARAGTPRRPLRRP